MKIDKAKQVFIKPENLHIMGLTPLHPYENKLQESKFFAFLRLVKDIPKQDGVQWLYIPNGYGYYDFLGVKVRRFPNGTYAITHKFAKLLP
jgi:hypothetical protein